MINILPNLRFIQVHFLEMQNMFCTGELTIIVLTFISISTDIKTITLSHLHLSQDGHWDIGCLKDV